MTRLAIIALLAAAPAWGHSFYSGYCCSAVNGTIGDCAPIPESAVRATPEGYLVTVTPENHARVSAPITRLFRYPDGDPSNDRGTIPEAMVSPDGQHHACVLPRSQEFRCFYAAPGAT
jgi:hypothetical protein